MAFDASADTGLDYDEVLACDDRVIVIRIAFRGHGRRPVSSSTRSAPCSLFEDGLWRGIDYYEPDDVGAMLAPFAQLGAPQSTIAVDREPADDENPHTP